MDKTRANNEVLIEEVIILFLKGRRLKPKKPSQVTVPAKLKSVPSTGIFCWLAYVMLVHFGKPRNLT